MQTSRATDEGGRRSGRAGVPRDRTGGYVLMELMLAMAVMAMIAALALPMRSSAGSPAALRAKASEIASILRVARNAALRSGRTTDVVVDRDAGRLRSAVSSVVVPAAMTLDLSPPTAGGFRFFADGRASPGAVRLQAGGASYVVRVNGLTAAVDVAVR